MDKSLDSVLCYEMTHRYVEVDSGALLREEKITRAAQRSVSVDIPTYLPKPTLMGNSVPRECISRPHEALREIFQPRVELKRCVNNLMGLLLILIIRLGISKIINNLLTDRQRSS